MSKFWVKWRLETHSSWTIEKMINTILGLLFCILCFLPLAFTELWWIFVIFSIYPVYIIIHFIITIISFVKTNGMHYDHYE